jgi:fructoselysine 6-kinase
VFEADMSMSVVAVGECTLDRYLDLGRTFVGGISLNFAVHARRSGAARAALVSRTGDDEGAALVRAHLAAAEVEAGYVGTLPGETAHQDVRLLPGGERHFPPGGYGAGVLARASLDEAALDYIRGFDVIAAPYFRQIAHMFEAVMRAPAPGTRHVADFLDGSDCGEDLAGLVAWLDRLDIAFLSADPSVAERLRPAARRSSTLVVVTHGAAGSTALRGDAVYTQAALPVADPLDSTGCGDAFQAAFTCAYLASGDVRAALERAAARAAEVLRRYGAS